MRLWWVSMSLFMELEGELGVLIFSCCSSNGIPHWLLTMEAVLSMSKWSEEKVSRRPPCPRNCVSMVGCVVVVVVYLLLGQGRE